MALEVPVAGASRFRDFRNGRKMWDLLPLWQEAEDLRAEVPQGAGNRSGRKGAEERRSGAIWNDGTSSVIPPEGPPTAASPRPSIRRQEPPGYSS